MLTDAPTPRNYNTLNPIKQQTLQPGIFLIQTKCYDVYSVYRDETTLNMTRSVTVPISKMLEMDDNLTDGGKYQWAKRNNNQIMQFPRYIEWVDLCCNWAVKVEGNVVELMLFEKPSTAATQRWHVSVLLSLSLVWMGAAYAMLKAFKSDMILLGALFSVVVMIVSLMGARAIESLAFPSYPLAFLSHPLFPVFPH